MKVIAPRWKTLLTTLVAGAMLLLASMQILVARPSSAQPQPPAAAAPVPEPAQAPASNEIRDFQQLG